MLDDFEDQRPLHLSEWNFWNIVKKQLDLLLNCKKNYWKQRCKVCWAKLGEENTPFYHSMATISFHQNSIASLSREDGSLDVDHKEKVGLLWYSF